ncbi:hypothetical protein GOP47_0007464 [Adiantum capillus-veneris]|uniref:Uncharacterized protein n=1 Tax=Adiantum capillus-veneris TaxID=13818 RepID=A0A9D4V0S0_ADICA|nr:hypothetical protein GOP47_0007464 [Adiantum capillus-veneris]
MDDGSVYTQTKGSKGINNVLDGIQSEITFLSQTKINLVTDGPQMNLLQVSEREAEEVICSKGYFLEPRSVALLMVGELCEIIVHKIVLIDQTFTFINHNREYDFYAD